MKINKYIGKFIYSIIGVFIGIFALFPIAILIGYFFWILYAAIEVSPWWLLTVIPAIAIIVGFGEKIIEWMQDMFERAGNLIKKIRL